MYSFYRLASNIRMILQILLYIGIVAQISYLIVFFLGGKEGRSLPRSLFELGIAAHYLVMNLSIGLIQMNLVLNRLVDPYPLLRNVSIVVVFLGVWLLLMEPRNADLLAMLCLGLSSPFMEGVLEENYAAVLVFTTLILFMRSCLQLLLLWRRMRREISRFSMKEAFDYFPDGLAIGRRRGRLLLLNRSMRRIMQQQGLSQAHHGTALRQSIFSLFQGSHSRVVQTNSPEGQVLGFESEGRVYRYSDQLFRIGQGAYEQFLVSDMTPAHELLEALREKNAELAESNQQLEDLLANIEEIEADREARRIRGRVHDVIGQRLSILHRYLEQMDGQSHVKLDELLPLLDSMLKDLREPDSFDPKLRLENIINTAELVGTTLTTVGELPEAAQARVMLQILREAVTNAIRHGQAKEVMVRFDEANGQVRMSVENDGSVPNQRVMEGEGISGMRRHLAEVDGQLEIRKGERFALLVSIPKTQ